MELAHNTDALMSAYQSLKWHTSLQLHFYKSTKYNISHPLLAQNELETSISAKTSNVLLRVYWVILHYICGKSFCSGIMGQIHLGIQWRHSASQWQGGEGQVVYTVLCCRHIKYYSDRVIYEMSVSFTKSVNVYYTLKLLFYVA